MRELSFLLSLKNSLSGPLGTAQKSVENFAKRSQEAFQQIGVGALGLWGVFKSAANILEPAHKVQVALDDLAARNVDGSVMEKIYKNALKFSTDYGRSAVDFIGSVTVIRSQLSGLADLELPRAAVAINTLAVATGSTAEAAAGYMSDMFNNYRRTVEQMGNIPFAEMMASKGAYMAQTFGASLENMRELIKGSKGMGDNYGVGIDEQFTVLGTLKGTMGSEAGGAYAGFLKSAAAGGQALGVSLTDAQGKLLAFPDMLDKLESKFGHTIAGNIKVQSALNKAFGDGASALTAAWGQAAKMRKQMSEMGNIAGMNRATEMAGILADMWDRIGVTWERIRISIGMRLLPAISPLTSAVLDAAVKFAQWLDMFPNIARWIGYITLATLAFAAAGALVNITLGVSKFIWMGLVPLWKLGVVLLSLLTGKLSIMTAVSTKLAGAFGWLKSILAPVIAAFSALTWPILALIAALAGVVIAVIKFWHPIKAFISGFIDGFTSASGALAPLAPLFDLLGAAVGVVWGWVKTLFSWFTDLLTPIQYSASELAGATDAGASFGRIVAEAIGLILTPLQWVIDLTSWLAEAFTATWTAISSGWQATCDFFAGLSPTEAFVKMISAISGLFDGLWKYLTESFNGTYNWIVGMLNKLPGINIELRQSAESAPQLPGLTPPPVTRGGISKAIASGSGNTTDNRRTFGDIYIQPQNKETWDTIIESRELNAG